MTEAACNLLFVYGSLITGIGHPMGARLRREAVLLGPGRVQGQLYRVSWYPGVVLSEHSDDWVHGEMYQLREPAATLAWLDEYEAITPGPTGVAASDEYERRIVSVSLLPGEGRRAWMYVYRREPRGLERVASGQWRG